MSICYFYGVILKIGLTENPEQIKTKNQEKIRGISAEMLQSAMRNFNDRLEDAIEDEDIFFILMVFLYFY